MRPITLEYLDTHERQIRTVGQMSRYIWSITGRYPEVDQEVNDLLQDMIDGAVIPLAYQGVGRGKTAYLMLEEAGADNKPAGDPFLFRMSGEEVPESLVNDTGLLVDMLGRELVWRTKSAKAARVR